jgi:hypothetical protein
VVSGGLLEIAVAFMMFEPFPLSIFNKKAYNNIFMKEFGRLMGIPIFDYLIRILNEQPFKIKLKDYY